MHPKETRRINGKLWHLEDSGLARADAIALRNHLKRTEDKKARVSKKPDGYEVWWARR